MVSTAIQFYFDFSSPYGYLASAKIDDLAARYGRDVAWQPILLGAVFKVTGAAPLPQIPLKGDYAKRDFSRSARLLEVPYRFPTVFPISSVVPSRAFYWLNKSDPAQAKALAKRLYHAFFVDDIDISQPEKTVAVAAGMGITKEAVEAGINQPEVKDLLRNEVRTALDRGVWGSPFFIVDGEPFHGSDRLDQVERWIKTGGW